MNEEMRIRTTELDETRTFLEGVLSSIAACVVVLDAELRVRSWNRGAEELWGLRPEEARQQPFATLDFGLPRAQAAEMVERCVAGKEHTGPIELTAVNRRGRTFTCSLSCSPLQGGSGVVLLMEAVDTW
jgi:two-component system CheB/CheR fusion protein